MPTKWDDKVRGLGLREHKSCETFVLRYRNHDGVEHLLKIGRLGEWTWAAARDEAKKLRREIDRGGDPADERRERREAPTVQDLVDRYVAEHLPQKQAKNRGLDYMARKVQYREALERKVLDDIARHLGKHARVADIHGGDVKKMHEALTRDRGPVMANRMLGTCSKMFALALVPMAGENAAWRDQAQGNPCKGIARNHEEGRSRFYSAAELTRIVEALDAYSAADGVGGHGSDSSVDAIKLIMLTGCRPQEARLAKWSEFSEPGYWTRPSAHVKTRKELRVPLAPGAVELVERLRKSRKVGQVWMFPGQKPGQPLATLEHPWRFVRKHAGLAATDRCYDLRHSFASIGAGGGLSLPIIGRLLGHAHPKTTARYAHLAPGPLEEAVGKIGAVYDGAIGNGKGKGGKVVPLRKNQT
jgi:integrase